AASANQPGGGGLQPLYDKPSPVPAGPRRTDPRVPAPPPRKPRRRYLVFGPRGRADGLTDDRERELKALCRVHLPRVRRIAVLSRKGGIGKTTTALLLGHELATLRGDHVVALDANPDAGSLGDRIPRETHGTITDILRQAGSLRSYADVRGLTSRAPSGLEVVASDNDPRITEALGWSDLQRVMNVLSRHYGIIIADTGTGILDPATQGVLAAADQIVVCAAPSIDSSRVTALTLDWLEQNGHRALVENAVVVINGVQDGIGDVDLLHHYFERRVRAVGRIPFDRQLAQGGETNLDDLAPPTRGAYLTLAGMVAAGFSW
ncbi:MAG: MinD/ParA family protein, partial [Candidatus Dormibacteraeota bacterium]|nr:MinD/ParA family protein [Candidatus Dormibacteraeota bacterium]